MRKILLLLALLASGAAHANCLTVNGHQLTVNGSPLCLDGSSSPFNLPALTQTQAQSMLSFVGSVSIPQAEYTGVPFSGGALYVTGNTAYIQGLFYNPSNSNQYLSGLAELTLPTPCSGYSGGSGCTATVVSTPVLPGYVPEKTYTLTSGYTAGDTCAVFSSGLPPGITANAGWYMYFGSADDDEVTSVGTCGGTNSVGWATALTTTYSSSIGVYQWNNYNNPWENQANCGGQDQITGSAIFNGELYVTGACSYDANYNAQLGWVLTGSTSLVNTGWGTGINTATSGGAAFPSRWLAGQMNTTPSIWQPYFGSAYVSSGPGLSVVSAYVSQGPSYFEFNPSNVTSSGSAVPVTPALQYSTTSGQSLDSRQYSGPFPTCTQTASCSPSATGYPLTLSSTPAAGDVSETVTVPTATVTAVANITASTGIADITSITSGTIDNSGVRYAVTDSAGVLPTGTDAIPSFDYPPGATLGTGNYAMGVPNGNATGDTLTMTPDGYYQGEGTNPTEWTMTFSDGESRVGSFAVASGGSQTFTFSPALTGTPSKSVTIAPMGNAWNTVYDGPAGGGFFVPNTSTWIAFSYHYNGPPSPRTNANPCGQGNASTSYYQLAPDTKVYGQALMFLYHASDLQAGANGSQAPYVASPYDVIQFPDASAPMLTSAGCFNISSPYDIGWTYFDQSTDMLYLSVGYVILEYKLTPP